jgi:hypothetical protein
VTILYCDFETRSRCDLRSRGVYNYAQDASTDVLCMSYAFDDEDVRTWLPGEPFPQAVKDHKGLVYAHNAAFERLIFWYVLQIDFKLEQFYCTAAQARANCAPGVIGAVGRAFSSRMAGDEREVAPAVTPSTTEDRAEPREVTIKGVKGNAPSSVTSATPGYDISTYGIDPYETISGAVRQGETTTNRDGTPDGGGEPDRRRPLTAEEIQYLADMGYLTNGAGASTATVNPSTAPIRYDISKFISGIGSLANSGNRFST